MAIIDNSTPRTRDGVAFCLGMPLVTETGGIIKTDPAAHAVVTEHDFTVGEPGCTPRNLGTVHLIQRKGSGMQTDLRRFYSSRRALLLDKRRDLEARIADLLEEVRDIDEQLEREP
jgi:hypothetical protein